MACLMRAVRNWGQDLSPSKDTDIDSAGLRGVINQDGSDPAEKAQKYLMGKLRPKDKPGAGSAAQARE